MCLAIPGKIESLSGEEPMLRVGKVNFGGIVKDVSLACVPDARIGDYVIVHVSFALSKVDEEEARITYKALEDMKQLGELETPEFNPAMFAPDGGSP